jgi:signal transduction histidine kinase
VRRRVVIAHLLLVAMVLVLLEVPLAVTFARRERDALAADVGRDATSLAALSEEVIEDPGEHDVAALARRFGARADGTVVVVDAHGQPVHPSVAPTADLSAPLRTALDQARRGHGSTGRTGGRAYAAEPLGSAAGGGDVHGAVLVAQSVDDTERRIHQLWLALGVIAVGALAVAWLVGARLAAWAIRPLRSLDERAAALGRGDLAARAEKGSGPPEVIELARTFNDMAGRLEELVGAQRRFVADASHQLRSPLAALRLRLDAIDLDDPRAAQSDIDAAVAETVRLSRLIDGLLTLAQAEGVRPDRHPTDVVALVEGRASAWSAFADEQDVDLQTDLPDHGVEVELVDGHLEQILDNLIDNAIEATPVGRSVTLVVRATPAHTEVHVVDQGAGMAPDEMARAFDRFWQGRQGHRSGSGLGLAIAAQLARANGGSLRLGPSPSGGVDAVVTLPPGRPARVGDPPGPTDRLVADN